MLLNWLVLVTYWCITFKIFKLRLSINFALGYSVSQCGCIQTSQHAALGLNYSLLSELQLNPGSATMQHTSLSLSENPQSGIPRCCLCTIAYWGIFSCKAEGKNYKCFFLLYNCNSVTEVEFSRS